MKKINSSAREDLNKLLDLYSKEFVDEWIVEYFEENFTAELEQAITEIYKYEINND